MVRDVREAWHPELAMVEMRVLFQLSLRPPHGHIHSKIRNRLEPATTEKLVYVYSNSKMVAATRDANELKMLAWAVHLMKMHSCNVTASAPAVHCPGGRSQPG